MPVFMGALKLHRTFVDDSKGIKWSIYPPGLVKEE